MRGPVPASRGRESGVALIVVLWILAILTLLMYSFLSQMRIEYALSAGYADEKKAEQLAWSAIDFGCAAALNNTKTSHALTDVEWSDDDFRFFEVPLGDGAFTLLHPTYGDDGRMLWGLDDENSKININVAPKEVLLRLPRMTEEIADSIIDWRDQDSNAGPSGAEDAYYLALNPPYRCKNQPFETLEELLLVRGMTPEILYGDDVNLNGRLDANENDGDVLYPPDNRDGKLDPGLWPLVTVWSSDPNTAQDGGPRANINGGDLQALAAAGLTPGEAQGVMAGLLRGPYLNIALLLGDPAAGRPRVLTNERFRTLADKLTTIEATSLPGLVNFNTAPKQVLLALPGMTEQLALEIMAYRAVAGADLSTMGWLLDLLEPAEFQPFAHLISFRSYQFRLHAVGRLGTPYASRATGEATERPRAFKRMTAVFDLRATPRARLVYWKDSTGLGMPYDPADGPAATTR
jgi:type II secretory pathway component PulK